MYEGLLRQRECKVCLSNLATVLFLPCGHLSACPACAPQLQVSDFLFSRLLTFTPELSRLPHANWQPTRYIPVLMLLKKLKPTKNRLIERNTLFPSRSKNKYKTKKLHIYRVMVFGRLFFSFFLSKVEKRF